MPSLFESNTKSINEMTSDPLKNGTHIYQVKEMRGFNRKSDNEFIVAMDAVDEDDVIYSHLFMVASPNADVKRFAQSAMKAAWDAAGFKGGSDLEMLPNFKGKFLEIGATRKEIDGKPRANIDFIKPASGFHSVPRPAPVHTPEDTLPGISEEPPKTYKLETPAATTPPVKNWRGAAAK